MNCHQARWKRVCPGAYYAMLRLPRDGEAKPIRDKDGRPIVYPTALAAQEASRRALEAYCDGNLVRSGETLSAQRCEAEKVFASLNKRRATA